MALLVILYMLHTGLAVLFRPDGGRKSTVARGTRRRAAPAYASIPDLMCTCCAKLTRKIRSALSPSIMIVDLGFWLNHLAGFSEEDTDTRSRGFEAGLQARKARLAFELATDVMRRARLFVVARDIQVALG